MYTELISVIQSADASELEDILDAAIKRKRELFPDWDILYLAIPKNDADERMRTYDYIRQWCFR